MTEKIKISDKNFGGYFDGLSIVPHHISMYFNKTPISQGTCFFVMSSDGPVLVTNRHNFTGRNNVTNKPLHSKCSIPNNAVVSLQTGSGEIFYHIDLVDHENPNKPSWIEHPTLGSKADIVALPTKELENVNNLGITLGDNWKRWNVGSELYVIGFPYGQIGGPFAIWSKGYIASEPDFDIAELPIFLIDCRSRPGQSGSPVYGQIRSGHIENYKGKEYAAKKDMYHFLGIYSGRLCPDSDLGFVWKRSCIEELVNHAVANGSQHKMERRRHKFHVEKNENYTLDCIITDAKHV